VKQKVGLHTIKNGEVLVQLHVRSWNLIIVHENL
jgi:hypothetical protein